MKITLPVDRSKYHHLSIAVHQGFALRGGQNINPQNDFVIIGGNEFNSQPNSRLN
jgi:hypothetical protein